MSSPSIYASIPFIKKYLEHLDPDTVVDIAAGDDGQYQGFYIVPGPASRVASMLLPVISFDASHLKGLGDRNAEGKVYLAVAPDGARNLHVLSIGHSGNEATSSWQLFLKHVLKFRAAMKAEEDTSPVMMADEHAGIEAALMELVPDENDRKEFLFCNCAKHRAGLIKKYFG